MHNGNTNLPKEVRVTKKELRNSKMKPYLKKDILTHLNQTVGNDLANLLNNSADAVEEFRKVVSESTVETVEKIVAEQKHSTDLYSMMRNISQEHRSALAASIRDHCVKEFPTLKEIAFDGVRKNAVGMDEIDFATYMAKQITHIDMFQYEDTFYENEKRMSEAKLSLHSYWLEGWQVIVKQFLFLLTAGVILFPFKLLIDWGVHKISNNSDIPLYITATGITLIVMFLLIVAPLLLRLSASVAGMHPIHKGTK